MKMKSRDGIAIVVAATGDASAERRRGETF